jgi:hypothetical protein
VNQSFDRCSAPVAYSVSHKFDFILTYVIFYLLFFFGNFIYTNVQSKVVEWKPRESVEVLYNKLYFYDIVFGHAVSLTLTHPEFPRTQPSFNNKFDNFYIDTLSL